MVKKKVLKKKGDVQHVAEENKWITSFLKETMDKETDLQKLQEVLQMYSQFLLRFAKNEIQLDEINRVEATTSEIFYPHYQISDMAVTPNQKVNEGKRGAIYNLQNGTFLKEESILPTPESVVQDKRINMFHNWKEAFIQYYLSHNVSKPIVPRLVFMKKKNNQSQIRMEKIQGITFYQFIQQNINDQKRLIDMWMKIAKLLDELQNQFQFVHGDFHAKNIMITEKEDLVFIDFGLSSFHKSPLMISVVQYDAKTNYIPDNQNNFSKSIDLFYMFMWLYKYIRENELPDGDKLLPLFQYLTQIPNTSLNLFELLFDYVKKYEDDSKYQSIHRISRHVHIVSKFLLQYHKKDSFIPFISKKTILQIRKRFEPEFFQKSLQQFLHKKTPYVPKDVSNSNFV